MVVATRPDRNTSGAQLRDSRNLSPWAYNLISMVHWSSRCGCLVTFKPNLLWAKAVPKLCWYHGMVMTSMFLTSVLHPGPLSNVILFWKGLVLLAQKLHSRLRCNIYSDAIFVYIPSSLNSIWLCTGVSIFRWKPN